MIQANSCFCFVILPHINNMVAKSSNQSGALFIPDVCPLRSSTLIFFHVSERYFFPTNCGKFAEE